jgi:hypothetical protein
VNPVLGRFYDALLADITSLENKSKRFAEYVRLGSVTREEAQSQIDRDVDGVRLKLDLLNAGFGFDLSSTP